jgi:glycosyltransferase involved in cell wall biosynthesis
MVTAAASLAAHVRRRGIGVIDCQTSRAHNIGLLVRRLVPDVHLVVHRRVDYPPTDALWSRRKYLSPLVDRYVCISRTIARVLSGYGVPHERITTVYSAVDRAVHDAVDRPSARQRLRAEFGLAGDTPVIGNLAYLTEQKGHETLLRALGTLRSRGTNFFCYIGGAGQLESSLRALAQELGLGAPVLRFIGIRDDAAQLLAGTDVFALSSNDEGLGTSLLDATHAGCALVATNVGGIPEVIEHERSGLLVPRGDHHAFANALGRVLADTELRGRLVLGAQAHVNATFTWDAMVRGNLAVYDAL